MNQETYDMLQKMVADRLPIVSPGDQAIIGMLTIISHQLNEMLQTQALMAKQFDQVSAGGTSVLTERAS